MLFDLEDKDPEAKAAFAKAAELGSTSAYGYFRLASLVWQPRPSRETLVAIDQHLTKAVELNTRYARAYAWLGEVKAFLNAGESIGLIQRAINLEPMEPSHRLRAASVLLRQGKPADARVQAQAALTLATSDDERREAQQLLAAISKPGGDLP